MAGLTRKTDAEFRFLLELDPDFEEWRSLAAEWFHRQEKSLNVRMAALKKFFIGYLLAQGFDLRPETLLAVHGAAPASLWQALGLDSLDNGFARSTNDYIYDFIDWIVETKNTADGGLPVYRNPFERSAPRVLCKSADLEFNYLLKLDPGMEDWRVLASEWLTGQLKAVAYKFGALDKFFAHIIDNNLERNPFNFLRRGYSLPPLVNTLLTPSKSGRGGNHKARSKPAPNDVVRINYICDFLDWILLEKVSVEDDLQHRIVPYEYNNPIARLSMSGTKPSETFKAPLAYCYIRELRTMLAQGPNFRDWIWAQEALGTSGGGDWFKVNEDAIDRDDPDCVWRLRPDGSGFVYEMWSPVRAVALYLKLELPLRTFQVRMLDSGEADTWRYESGKWCLNESKLANGTERRPFNKGVFHRAHNESGAGFYINTNKTADTNKDEQSKGYVIPWAHEPALYWLEKLRNWQERYNPILQPTPWHHLEAKHFGQTPPHQSVLEERGECCFLFRDAKAEVISDRSKPIGPHALDRLWYLLLAELEKICQARGETLDDGTPFRFVESDNYRNTFYPLHALRVSLITAYALDGGVPFPILSKLIAGHARLIMTLYYTKAGKAHVTEIMQDAEKRLLESDALSHRRFLMEKSYEEINERFAFNSADTLKTVLQQNTAASFVFEDKGICPVAGGLCDVGGESQSGVNGPVPGYPHERNCVRCRFFITGPAFLPGLIAHFNWVSYQASECSSRYVRLEQEVKGLEDARMECELQGVPFTRHQDLQRLNHHHEAEAEKANKLLHDFQAVHRLIERCIAISNSRVAEDAGMQLVTSGGLHDLKYALTETNSELHQLEVICENAMVYPGIDASKATLRRSQVLDIMLQMNGQAPVFFRLGPDQQLRVGNEVMKLIQARTGSLKEAVEIAEGRRLLSDFGLLDEATGLIGNEASISFNHITNAEAGYPHIIERF